MTCRELLNAIDPYLDGELSSVEVLRVHEHLLDCARCRSMLESEAGLHALLRSDAIEDTPPPGLRDRVLVRIGGPSSGSVPSPARPRRPRGLRALLTGVGLIAVLLASVLVIRFWRPLDLPPFVLETAAKHRLYTEGRSPALDLTTSDGVRLAEWLERRVGFPVKAPAPMPSTAHLLGGRVSSVADVPAAYLLYEWQGRMLSLFVTAPQPRSRPEGAERVLDGVELYRATLPGATLVWWGDSGQLYTAVSTGPVAPLEEFAVLCARGRARTSAPEPMRVVRRG